MQDIPVRWSVHADGLAAQDIPEAPDDPINGTATACVFGPGEARLRCGPSSLLLANAVEDISGDLGPPRNGSLARRAHGCSKGGTDLEVMEGKVYAQSVP